VPQDSVFEVEGLTEFSAFQHGVQSALDSEFTTFIAEHPSARDAASTTLACTQVPTASDVSTGTFTFINTIVSASQAVKLNLPIGLTGALDANSKLLVVDYTRSATCPTQDANVSFVYGHTIRAVIHLQDYEGSLGTSLASIAANGTLRRKSQTISVYSLGINNPKLQGYLGQIYGKDFNVENYSSFITFMNNITTLPSDPGTTTSVQYIGRTDNRLFNQSVAMAFALYQLTRREHCMAARQGLPNHLSQEIHSVRDVYVTVMGTCDTTQPSQLQALQARQYLGDLRVH
jgi:hypothetical protein